MHTVEEINIGYDVLEANSKLARKNRNILDEFRITAFNIMGAIGSGKTMLVEKTIERIGKSFRIGAIAGDVVARLDASRFEKSGIPVVGLNTGKECHLDAHLVEHGLNSLPLDSLDILFIENVGNLICPTDYELGEHKMVRDARTINPGIDVLKMSLRTGEGLYEWIKFVKKSIKYDAK
ncbi:MAG: hydrogenase nickel incorporation protein HypB [Euryarchaeota archaeon]|nr:hydrogenase nickel incorporation protein HypB [Euryarchaeota archaeon]MDP3105049.1 hydrogenase nickel incorporation protein HypB [Candidatus Methanoperedens sp.]